MLERYIAYRDRFGGVRIIDTLGLREIYLQPGDDSSPIGAYPSQAELAEYFNEE